MIFTFHERTVKKYTIAWALSQAEKVIQAKHPEIKTCINAIDRGRDYNELITLEEASKLIEKIVDDSYYHAGYFSIIR